MYRPNKNWALPRTTNEGFNVADTKFRASYIGVTGYNNEIVLSINEILKPVLFTQEMFRQGKVAQI